MSSIKLSKNVSKKSVAKGKAKKSAEGAPPIRVNRPSAASLMSLSDPPLIGGNANPPADASSAEALDPPPNASRPSSGQAQAPIINDADHRDDLVSIHSNDDQQQEMEDDEEASSVVSGQRIEDHDDEVKQPERCQFTYKDLQADGHKLNHVCPFCGWQVYSHTITKEVQPSNASRIIKEALHIIEKQNCTWPVTSVGQHTKAETSSKMFFNRLEVALRAAKYDSQVYVSLLPLLMTNEADKRWVDNYIANAQPQLTWDQAKAKFSAHFDSRSLIDDLRTEFRSLTQHSYESVQSFASRFLYYVEALEMKDEANAISEFKFRLRNNIANEVNRMIHTTGESKFYAEYCSLNKFIERCIEASRICTFTHSSEREHSSSTSSHSSSIPAAKRHIERSKGDNTQPKRSRAQVQPEPGSGLLYCVNHLWCKHASVDCRIEIAKLVKPDAPRSRESNSHANTNQRSGNVPLPPYVCDNCKIPGHWKQDCPKPHQRPANAGPTPGKPANDNNKSSFHPPIKMSRMATRSQPLQQNSANESGQNEQPDDNDRE